MALIIPEAQTPFSLVEQPRLNPNAPNIGDAIGQLADVGVAIKAQKVKAEQDRMVRTARLTAAENLDKLAVDFENDANLEGLSERWAAQSGAIAGDVAKGLPAHLQKDFELSMREMIAPQTVAVQRREYALFKDQETASLNSDLRRYESLAANASTDDGRMAVYKDAAATIGAAQDAGLISAVEADAMTADLPANTERIAALKLIDEDPQAYLDSRKAGDMGFLDPEEAARFDIAAKSAVATEATRRTKEDQLIATAADKELGDRTDSAIKIIEGGLRYSDLPGLLTETKGTAHYDRLIASIDATSTAGNFALMTPAEQKAELNRQKNSLRGDPADVARVNRLETMAANTKESLAADPIAHVRDRRILDIQPVDIGDPASVRRRIAEAETVTRDFTPDATSIRYFDKTEADALTAVLAGKDVDQALATLTAITQNFGDRAPMVLGELGATEPVVQLAGALVAETGDVAVARAMLQGRAMKAEGEGAAVNAENRRAVQADFTAAFPPADTRRLTALMTAADAHYAASGMGNADPASDEARTAYRNSVIAVSGGVTRNGVQYGGLQEVNGKLTVLPGNVTAGQVTSAITMFDEDSWKRGSITGNAPMWGPNLPVHKVDADQRAELNLLSMGNGIYALGYTRADGSTVYMRDASQRDGLFRFDLSRMLTGRSASGAAP